MSNITREIWIDASKEDVWAALADFGNIYRFNPSVPRSYSTNGKPSGLGAARHCELNIQGASVEERIIGWEDGKMMRVEIIGGEKTPPWKNPVAELSVQEHQDGTLVRGAFNYQMKYGPVGALMDRFMVQPQFGKAFGGILAGLKHYMETGEQVHGSQGLPFDQVILSPA